MDSGSIYPAAPVTQDISHSFSSHPVLSTVDQFAAKHPAFSPSSLRNLIFLASDRHTSKGLIRGNGLDKAIVRIGKRVLIDEAGFFSWIMEQQA